MIGTIGGHNVTTSELSTKPGLFLGRLWEPEVGPLLIKIRDGEVFDITDRAAPTSRDLLELDNPADYLNAARGRLLCDLAGLEADSLRAQSDPARRHLLAPCDLQAVKAAGVTFAKSMVERVIEERAAGDPHAAREIRDRIGALIGDSLSDIEPGSDKAEAVKQALIKEGLWSQYLEVGIGPDAEVFSKAQILSAVGWGAPIGLHPKSVWNNPEPEIVLAVNSKGTILGACLGNDVNLRDFEGRSALLLSKAKDNNASASIGPFIRLFDADFGMAELCKAGLKMTVTGKDGFELTGYSNMAEISRAPEIIVRQTIGPHHQYPDGFMLYLGTLFAPTEDRDVAGEGFTHKIGDMVEISSPDFGRLCNSVRLSTECPAWTFGTAALMRNLSQRNLI